MKIKNILFYFLPDSKALEGVKVVATLQTLRATAVGCSSVVAVWRVIAPMGLAKFLLKLVVQYFELPDGLLWYSSFCCPGQEPRPDSLSIQFSFPTHLILFYVYVCSQTNKNLSK
jgi:hypothetical protein